MHRYRRSPRWFASDGAGRFDLPVQHGTCYLAIDPLATLLEVARGLTIVPEDFLASRRLVSASLPSDLRLADLTAPGAYSFGITGELSATAGYTVPRAWALALHAAGFDGIRYHVHHGPRSELTGIAWLGRAGQRPRPLPAFSRPVPADVLMADAPVGIRVAARLPAE